MAELVNRETARGAERAKDLMDSMIGYLKKKSAKLKEVSMQEL
jgi:hypothetical protein